MLTGLLARATMTSLSLLMCCLQRAEGKQKIPIQVCSSKCIHLLTALIMSLSSACLQHYANSSAACSIMLKTVAPAGVTGCLCCKGGG